MRPRLAPRPKSPRPGSFVSIWRDWPSKTDPSFPPRCSARWRPPDAFPLTREISRTQSGPARGASGQAFAPSAPVSAPAFRVRRRATAHRHGYRPPHVPWVPRVCSKGGAALPRAFRFCQCPPGPLRWPGCARSSTSWMRSTGMNTLIEWCLSPVSTASATVTRSPRPRRNTSLTPWPTTT